MSWWDEKAVRWQERNREDEGKVEDWLIPDPLGPYSRAGIRRAIVHTREDVTMIVAYLSALNRQTATIKWLLTALVILAAYIALRMSVRF